MPLKSRTGTEIREDRYKADLALLDRYQAFSAELLRLSLLGITGYGFLLTYTIFADSTKQNSLKLGVTGKWFLAFGVVFLGVSAAAAVAHRYFSTDSMAHMLGYIRKAYGEHPAEELKLKEELEGQFADFRRSRWLLTISAICLALGAVATAVTFVTVLF